MTMRRVLSDMIGWENADDLQEGEVVELVRLGGPQDGRSLGLWKMIAEGDSAAGCRSTRARVRPEQKGSIDGWPIP